MNIKIKDKNGITLKTKGKYVTEDIAVGIDESLLGSEGATITRKGGGTVVPNTGYVEKVYFNTSLSNEEVVAELEKLTYIETGLNAIGNSLLLDQSYSKLITVLKNDNLLTIKNFTDMTTYFTTVDDGGGFVGWNPNFSGEIEINSEVLNDMNGTPFGAENDKITNLFSATPFGSGSSEVVKLEGDYDGSTLVLDELPKGGWNGTTVPNNKFVDKIYFNTNLSVDEVVDIVDNLFKNRDESGIDESNPINYSVAMTYNTDVMKTLLITYNLEINVCVITYVSYNMVNGQPDIANVVQINAFSLDSGWHTDVVNPIVYGAEVMATVPTSEVASGISNDLISNLISITPFTQSKPNTINVKSLIEQKKIPLEIEVNSSGVEIPSVTDLVVENNVATWTTPDFTNVNKHNPTSITYVVSVNETEIETSETTFNVSGYLKDGLNTISVRVKVIYDGIESNIVEYSKSATVTLLNTQLQYNMGWINDYRASPKLVGTNIYTFGGRGDGTYYNTIHKFDTLTEKVTSLGRYLLKYMLTDTVAVGTNIYTFGGEGDSSTHPNTIAKFNTISETISTLSSTLPKDSTGTYDVHKVYPVVKGNIIYTFGGLYYNSTYNVRTSLPINYILKFDTTTETLEKLSVTLPSEMSAISTVLHNDVIYIFGGYNYNTSARFNTILKFDTTTETLETLNVTLPKGTDMVYPYKINNIIYLFNARGNAKEVYKFDIATETITTLDVALPSTSQVFIPIGTDVYNFNVKAVYRFDTTTETLEELFIQMLISTANSAYGVINNTIYFFGGYDSGAHVKDIYKFTP